MNELLTVNNDTQTVSARELHERLHIKTAFKDWFPRMCEYGFEEGADFCSKLSETSQKGGRPAKDADISIDMAKQICMIQRTPEGKKCRQYLIDLEKAWNTPEQIFARALRMADETINNLKLKIKEQKPLVTFAENVASSADAISMKQMANLAQDEHIDIGRNRLIRFLKENKILMKDNTPYQQYLDRKYFDVIKVPKHTVCGEMYFPTTVVTGKGQIWLLNKLKEEYGN
mgnify:FL=1